MILIHLIPGVIEIIQNTTDSVAVKIDDTKHDETLKRIDDIGQDAKLVDFFWAHFPVQTPGNQLKNPGDSHDKEHLNDCP